MTTAPYTINWNTPLRPTARTRSPRARDAAGNQTTSAARALHRVEQRAGHDAPHSERECASGGTTIGGTVSVTATATDNVGVVGVNYCSTGLRWGLSTTAPIA